MPNVTVFGDRGFMEVIKLNELISVDPDRIGLVSLTRRDARELGVYLSASPLLSLPFPLPLPLSLSAT
jgi:hypothetical protein